VQKSERSAQARRELDRKFNEADLEPIRAIPRLGWIRAVRGALGMSQAVLAKRLGVSAAAVNKLEQAERHGGVTIRKLAEVASALDCTFVYALVPRSTLEQTVTNQAHRVAADMLGYVSRTMALESQGIGDEREREAVDRYAQQLTSSGNVWRAGLEGSSADA
jgi:predicted DNA-binding mobile mystery protein A